MPGQLSVTLMPSGAPRAPGGLPQHAVQVICDHLGLAQNHGRNRCSSVTLSAARWSLSRLLCSRHLICCPTSPERVVCSSLWAGRLQLRRGPCAEDLESWTSPMSACSAALQFLCAFPLGPLSLPPLGPSGGSHLGRLCPPTETDYSVGSRNLIFRCDACRGHQCLL